VNIQLGVDSSFQNAVAEIPFLHIPLNDEHAFLCSWNNAWTLHAKGPYLATREETKFKDFSVTFHVPVIVIP